MVKQNVENFEQTKLLIVNNNTFCFTTIDNITRNRMQNPMIKTKLYPSLSNMNTKCSWGLRNTKSCR
jgi:hypothetical protein